MLYTDNPSCEMPPYTLRVTSEPYAEPCDLNEIKSHLRVDGSDEDELISAWITAARQYCEDITARQIVTATFKMTMDRFPYSVGGWRSLESYAAGGGGTIVIPRAPLQSVSAITYVDSTGATSTVSSSDYLVRVEKQPARVTPAYGLFWPTARVQAEAIIINFVAGQITPFVAVASTDVCTALGRTYTNGDILRLFNSGGALPAGLAALTDYYVISASGSTFKLSLTLSGAAVDITDIGQGTHFASNPSSGLAEIEGLRAAIKLMVGHWYENRETSSEGNLKDIPMGVEALLWQRRIFV